MESLLNKKQILITREKTQAKLFEKQIINNNGVPITAPLLKIAPFYDENSESILTSLNDFDWLFFTSVNGVNHFFKQVVNTDLLHNCKIAVVGHKTAEALHQYGFSAQFMPTTYNAETMAAEFLSKVGTVNRVLFIRGNLSRPTLLTEFTKANIPYSKIVVYETKVNKAIEHDLIKKLEKGIDFLTFTSPSTVRAFVELVQDSSLLKQAQEKYCFCIGTTTEQVAIDYNFKHTFIPTEFTIDSMVNKMIDVVEKETS